VVFSTYRSICFRSRTWLIVTRCTQDAAAAATGLSCSLMRLRMNCKTSGRRLALPSRCWAWVEKSFVVKASYLPSQNLGTQTHNVSEVQNSMEQMCLILMCCDVYKVYYDSYVKCQGLFVGLLGMRSCIPSKMLSISDERWIVRCLVYTPATWKVLIMLCHRHKTAVCCLCCVSFVNRSVHVMSSDKY